MRWGPILVIAAIVVTAFGLFILLAGLAADPQIEQAATDDSPDTIILARRVISIPFGIADTLSLRNENQVLVTGTGICGPGGEDFRIQAQVTQDGVSAPAVGNTEGLCLGNAPSSWQATAVLPGRHTFEPGAATACGMAVIHYQREGAITYQWCKAVIIE
jgi:hypothetical protein